MDDVTAEVDEREEYSNDFDDGGDTVSRDACKLSDLAQDVTDLKQLVPGDSEIKDKEREHEEYSSVKEDQIFESVEDHQTNQHANLMNTA